MHSSNAFGKSVCSLKTDCPTSVGTADRFCYADSGGYDVGQAKREFATKSLFDCRVSAAVSRRIGTFVPIALSLSP